jgi:hypothetical protein
VVVARGAARRAVRNSSFLVLDRPSFELADLVVLDGVSYFNWPAADFAVFYVGLPLNRGVQHHRNPFRAVGAREDVLHSAHDKGLDCILASLGVWHGRVDSLSCDSEQSSTDAATTNARYLIDSRFGGVAAAVSLDGAEEGFNGGCKFDKSDRHKEAIVVVHRLIVSKT